MEYAMTLTLNAAGQRVETDPSLSQQTKPVELEFQPVVVTGGSQVNAQTSTAARPQATLAISIDPAKIQS
jgi:hypothetical protein